ncbi:MAG: DUF177 domain-containing protein [Lachnospiraceae bacterium]|nr:DUF177 domain-containing protein [Lachnospiraceae bacterium]
MQLNLTEYLESEGKQKQMSVSYEKEALALWPTPVALSEPFQMELTIQNLKKGEILIKGSGTVRCKAQCDRCLKDCDIEVSIDTEEIITDQMAKNAGDPENPGFLDGYEIDTDEMIEEAAAENFPTKILCKEDCKGICKVCGKDLNEGDCGCDQFVPDPRMAAIGEIFAKSQK